AASPAGAVVIAAVPGSFQTTYATPVAVAPTGGPLFFVNTDLQPHNVVAQKGVLSRAQAKKAPWCKMYLPTKCPVFWSQTISNNATQVQLQFTKPGTYTFYCTIHPRMTG